MKTPESNRIVIEGIDGSGKSTAALDAAKLLGELYPATTIKVVDSSGVHQFSHGERLDPRLNDIDKLIPKAEHSKLRSIIQLGAFTTARRFAESWLLSGYTDLVVSVRDPFRIDPAVYASVYGPSWLQRLDAVTRLKVFNGLTVASHPLSIIHLQVDQEKTKTNTDNPDFHETPERMARTASELPYVIGAYAQMLGIEVHEIPALSPATVDQVAARLEPAIVKAMASSDAKNLRAEYI